MKGLANVGDVLGGKYKVERILGIGGMGMVVLATHLELEQSVAIKFMLPQALENPEAAARFTREARAAGRLTNDHVCRVTDVGKFEGGAPYIVMEYMEGQDLGTLLKRKGAQPVDVAVDYILQACEGMAEAHGHGIIHRDLKPDNLFLATRSDGNQIIKILDFGISKAATGVATKTGDIMGSPAYMAPEQMQSTKDVDQRADIWSLGVLLYQLISGRMPFVADTLPALCLAVLNEAPPSLESVRKDLPHGLAQVVMKCLAKSKNDRYRNVHELAQALSAYGKPDATGAAVTRIRSMLQRKRPPTPPPLMMLPSEFSDVAPTLMGSSDSLDVPKEVLASGQQPRMPAAATRTTMGGATGESMSLLNQTRRPGVIGALLGAIALVALIIVMVAVKRGSSETAAAGEPPTPPVAKPPTPEIKPEPKPEPKAEPKVEPVDPTPTLVVDETPPTLDGSGGRPKDPKDPKAKTPKDPKAKDPKAALVKDPKAKDPKDPKDPKNTAGSGDDDDDKWGHMQHDGDKKDPPKE